MNVKKGKLTPSEENVMNYFWSSNEPLSSREILDLSGQRWSMEQVSNILRSLERKKMIELCGKKIGKTRPDGKAQPVRLFKVLVAKGEYLADMVGEKGADQKFLHKVSAALVEKIGVEAVIDELEEIIKELEMKNG